MALQNRVTPEGQIVAEPWRGTLTGNRGILHDAEGRLGTARWRHANWICCLTRFRGRWRPPMPGPGARSRWTALFFWDEACAFAAGHRPCAECRWADYRRFRAAWAAAGLPEGRAAELDRHLHRARVTRDRRQVTHRAEAASLPVGTFVRAGGPVLIGPRGPLAWAGGYRPLDAPLPREIEVLTPAPLVAVFRAGYAPQIRAG